MYSSILKKYSLLFLFLIAYLVYAFSSFQQFGITNDEHEEYLLGSFLYTKLRAQDQILEEDFVVNKNTNHNLLYYDRIYPAILFALNPTMSYENYHLLNLLFAVPIFVICYGLVLHSTKNKYLAFTSLMLLVLTPRFFGDIAANPKDIPFAQAYLLALACIYFFRKNQHPWVTIFLGLSFGLAQSLRSIGFSIYAVFLLFSISQWQLKKRSHILEKIVTLASQTILIMAVAFLIQIITLPYLGADFIHNLTELFNVARQFPWQGEVMLWGNLIPVSQLPWYYLPSWFLVTSPLFLFLLIPLALKQIKHKLVQLLLISVVLNISLVWILKPVIYDGLRHFLFLLPQLVMLAIFGLLTLNKLSYKKKIIGYSFLVISICEITFSSIRLFPYQYLYFIPLIGGLAGAQTKFDLDYWGASYKEAIKNTKQLIEENQSYKVLTCGDPTQTQYYLPTNWQLTDKIEEAEIVICAHRNIAKKYHVPDDFKVVSEVSRMGVPINQVWIRQNPKPGTN